MAVWSDCLQNQTRELEELLHLGCRPGKNIPQGQLVFLKSTAVSLEGLEVSAEVHKRDFAAQLCSSRVFPSHACGTCIALNT